MDGILLGFVAIASLKAPCTDGERSALIRAIIAYHEDGEVPPETAVHPVVWRVVQEEVDRLKARDEEFHAMTTERARKAALSRWRKEGMPVASTSTPSNAKDATSMHKHAQACTSTPSNAKDAKDAIDIDIHSIGLKQSINQSLKPMLNPSTPKPPSPLADATNATNTPAVTPTAITPTTSTNAATKPTITPTTATPLSGTIARITASEPQSGGGHKYTPQHGERALPMLQATKTAYTASSVPIPLATTPKSYPSATPQRSPASNQRVPTATPMHWDYTSINEPSTDPVKVVLSFLDNDATVYNQAALRSILRTIGDKRFRSIAATVYGCWSAGEYEEVRSRGAVIMTLFRDAEKAFLASKQQPTNS